MRRMLLGLAMLAIALPVKAEEHVLHEAIVGNVGVICDTVDEVKSFIEVHEAKSGVSPPGCGGLDAPVVVRMVAVGTYETAKRKYLLVRYEFLSIPLPPQYGIGGVRDDGEPA